MSQTNAERDSAFVEALSWRSLPHCPAVFRRQVPIFRGWEGGGQLRAQR